MHTCRCVFHEVNKEHLQNHIQCLAIQTRWWKRTNSNNIYSWAVSCLPLMQVGCFTHKEQHAHCRLIIVLFALIFMVFVLCFVYWCIISCSVFYFVFQPLFSLDAEEAFDVLLLLKQLSGSFLGHVRVVCPKVFQGHIRENLMQECCLVSYWHFPYISHTQSDIIFSSA